MNKKMSGQTVVQLWTIKRRINLIKIRVSCANFTNLITYIFGIAASYNSTRFRCMLRDGKVTK